MSYFPFLKFREKIENLASWEQRASPEGRCSLPPSYGPAWRLFNEKQSASQVRLIKLKKS